MAQNLTAITLSSLWHFFKSKVEFYLLSSVAAFKGVYHEFSGYRRAKKES